MLLGEAPGADEEAAGIPFVGASGRLLKRDLMPSAGLDPDQWNMLNVFTARPPNNDIKLWTANKTELKKLGQVPQGDPLNKRYLLAEHRHHLAELDRRLRELQPDLILCLGGTALWAIGGDGAIGTHRGTFFKSRYGLAIATYHPAAILRQWSNKPVAWADMRKVAAHLDGSLDAPLRRRFYINPTWEEIALVYSQFAANPSWLLGVDIETCPGIDQLTTISFSTATLGICIPFWDKDNHSGGHNYWPRVSDERKAWRWVDRFAQLANPKVLQNGLYDTAYLMDGPLSIRLRNYYDDTAILHHALQPELQKSLGFLSSVYLNEPSWKSMRTASKDQNKADE